MVELITVITVLIVLTILYVSICLTSTYIIYRLQKGGNKDV